MPGALARACHWCGALPCAVVSLLQEQPRPQDKDHHTRRKPDYLVGTTSFLLFSISPLCASFVNLRRLSIHLCCSTFSVTLTDLPLRYADPGTYTKSSSQLLHRGASRVWNQNLIHCITPMPTPRSQPTRTSQRRNSQQDDTPVRTRAGRGGKPALSKPDQPDFVPERPSPTKLSPTTTRKTTRSASNISGRSFEVAPEVYASYEEPLFMVFGLSPEFFDGLKKHHGKLPKERKSLVSSISQADETAEEGDDSESEEESADESDVEEQPVSHAAPRGRGRGGRGARGGRGRGGRGRGRGRGGRARGGMARAISPARARASRNAALMNPLTEEDDDDSANQDSRDYRAKPNSVPNDEPMGEAVDSEDDNENAIADDESDINGEETQDVRKVSATPESSPPPGLHDSILGGTYLPPSAPEPDPGPSTKMSKNLAVPKILHKSKSATQTPRTSTPAESAVPKLLRPEDDVLSDSDLPEPWVEDLPPPIEADCEDRADYLLQLRYKPMVDVHEVIASLTKYPVSQRSTESLYALAENTQNILKQWQDQYLTLDARVRIMTLSMDHANAEIDGATHAPC
jgi:hypothetical protein